MKILLDESLPKRLKRHFTGHTVKTVPEMRWQGRKNGELMASMAGKFDVFITADQNLTYQINLRHALVPVIVLRSPTNRYQDLVHLVPGILEKLKISTLRKVTIVEN